MHDHKLRFVIVLLIAALLLGVARLWHQGPVHESIYVPLSLVLKTALACFGLMYLATGLLMQHRARAQIQTPIRVDH